MKEKDNIDQWLQKSMADFRPALSDSARERFLSEAPAEVSGTSNGRLYVTLGVVILLSVTALIWLSTDRSENTQVNDQKTNTTVVDKAANSGDINNKNNAGDNQYQKTDITDHNAKTQIHLQDNKSISSSVKEVAYRSKEVTTKAAAQPGGSKTGGSKSSVRNPDSGSTSSIANADKPVSNALADKTFESFADNTGARQKEEDINATKTLTDKPEGVALDNNETTANNSYQSSSDTNKNKSDSNGGIAEPLDNKGLKEKKGTNFMNQSLSLYYRPEIIWNVIDNEKLIHNFGAEWQTRLFSGSYLLGTGMGISLTRGYYEYAIEYNEFLGNYQQLDSITFEWNPREFSMQQTVHTSEETVFDTAVKVDYARVYRDFVYLQIPFTMGYDFVQKSKYSVGVRFVPILSVLLSKKPVDFRYEAGNDRIVQINRITPDRVHTNWQLNAGINYSRRLSETFWMELEPRFTYYFNSVYEKSDNSSSPMGASIRVAVGIKY